MYKFDEKENYIPQSPSSDVIVQKVLSDSPLPVSSEDTLNSWNLEILGRFSAFVKPKKEFTRSFSKRIDWIATMMERNNINQFTTLFEKQVLLQGLRPRGGVDAAQVHHRVLVRVSSL